MATQASAVIERLIDDDYLHEELMAAGARLRDAYRRARRLPGRRAVQDEKLYDQVRQGVGALTEVVRRAAGKPEPKRGHRLRRLFLMLVAAGGAGVAVRSWQQSQQQQPPVTPGEPAAEAQVPVT
jgi:hypothetical protein